MGVQAKIADMEAALAERGVPVARLCEDAGIETSTWWRWKNGGMPTFRTWGKAEEAFGRLTAEAPSAGTPASSEAA